MSTEYIGSVTLYLDAAEVEITKIDIKDSTGRKPVKTMNRSRRTKGFTRGVGQPPVVGRSNRRHQNCHREQYPLNVTQHN